MNRFLTSTALALSLATAAVADTAGNMDWSAQMEPQAGQFYGSDLIGMRIYRAETDYDNWSSVEAGSEQEWDDIGEINDLIISKDGEVDAVILGIGGFLGMGERDVAIQMDAIRVVHEQDDPNSRFLVVNATKEQLETVPEYAHRAEAMTDGEKVAKMDDTDENQVDQASTDSTQQAATDDTTQTDVPPMQRPLVEREGYAEVEMVDAQKITVDELQGARVYGVNDEDLGEISDLVVDEGKLTLAVVDVGGFLGMGEKPVGVDFDKLQILKRQDSEELRVYMDATEESLKAQPEYSSR